MMKHLRYFLVALLFLGAGVKLMAADTNVAQRINFAIVGTYEETTTNAITYYSRTNILVYSNIVVTGSGTVTNLHTNLFPITYSSLTNHVIKTIFFNAPNVVKAIAVDLDQFRGPAGATTNLTGGSLYRKVDINTGTESIVIRKPHGGTNIEVDVTAFFGGPAAIANNFNTVGEIATSTQTAGGIKTNLAVSMNNVSFFSTNLQFSITNAYGKSFLTTLANTRVKNLMASGAGTFFVDINNLLSSTNHYFSDTNYPTNLYTTNVILVTNYALNIPGLTNVYNIDTIVPVTNTSITNVTGPAHGTFSTTVGSILK